MDYILKTSPANVNIFLTKRLAFGRKPEKMIRKTNEQSPN